MIRGRSFLIRVDNLSQSEQLKGVYAYSTMQKIPKGGSLELRIPVGFYFSAILN